MIIIALTRRVRNAASRVAYRRHSSPEHGGSRRQKDWLDPSAAWGRTRRSLSCPSRPPYFSVRTASQDSAPLRQTLIVCFAAFGIGEARKNEGVPFRSRLVSALPSSVTRGIAFVPITREYSKLISRSILGFEFAIDAILSRSSVERERVGRLRTALRNWVSSAARASSAGDVVSLRVIRGNSSAHGPCR